MWFLSGTNVHRHRHQYIVVWNPDSSRCDQQDQRNETRIVGDSTCQCHEWGQFHLPVNENYFADFILCVLKMSATLIRAEFLYHIGDNCVYWHMSCRFVTYIYIIYSHTEDITWNIHTYVLFADFYINLTIRKRKKKLHTWIIHYAFIDMSYMP